MWGFNIFCWNSKRSKRYDKKVTGITYDSHDALVIKSFEEIYKEAETKFKFEQYRCVY